MTIQAQKKKLEITLDVQGKAMPLPRYQFSTLFADLKEKHLRH